ncbi:hypothetical protein FOZ62_023400, partial [Perkinsus olseni]
SSQILCSEGLTVLPLGYEMVSKPRPLFAAEAVGQYLKVLPQLVPQARVRLRGCLVECGRAVDYNFGRPSITEAQPLAQMSHIRAKNVVKHEGCICRYCHLYIFCATSLTLNSIKAPEDCRNLMEEIVGTLRDRPESACFRVMNSMVDLGEAESRIFVKPKAPVLDHVGWHERAVAFPGSPPRHHEAFRDVWRRGSYSLPVEGM